MPSAFARFHARITGAAVIAGVLAAVIAHTPNDWRGFRNLIASALAFVGVSTSHNLRALSARQPQRQRSVIPP